MTRIKVNDIIELPVYLKNASLCFRSRQTDHTERSRNDEQEIPDHLVRVPVAPTPRPPRPSPQVTPDYLVPINPRNPLDRLPAIPDISSDYLTPVRIATNNEEEEQDVPLYDAPVVPREQYSGDNEYQRLHLYEIVE